MPKIELTRVGGDTILDGLRAMQLASIDTAPVMREIAAIMADRVEESFFREESPEGNPWADLKPVTQKLRAAVGKYPGKKLQVIGKLAASVQSQSGRDFALVGTNKVYAAMMHFGGVTSQKSMIPGKTIPARPYLGINNDDREEILAAIQQHFFDALKPI